MAAKITAGDVLVYIPNLIGYLRVALTLTSIVLMICSPDHWIIAIVCYVASFVGDLFDGMAARKFDQCSSYGGLIDMVTDRCSTAGLLCVLSREYSSDPTLVLVGRRRRHACMPSLVQSQKSTRRIPKVTVKNNLTLMFRTSSSRC
jgi:phosphatidylglycerophosphate synthase